MDLLTRDALNELLILRESPCVSLYLPLQKAGAHAHENATRLKAALDDVEQRLANVGLSPKGQSQFLAPARAFADEWLMMPATNDTVALFLAPDFFRAYAVPFAVKEVTLVSGRFHIIPLLQILETDVQFYVLAMSRNRCRLIRATADGAMEVVVPGMPANMQAAWEGMEHTEPTNISKDQDDLEIGVYLQKVSRAIEASFTGIRAPLVFAGVEELWGHFRKMCAYREVAEEYVHGNPDDADEQQLRQSAEPIAQTVLMTEREKALKRYEAGVGAIKTSLLPLDILEAAKEGRVDTLLVADGLTLWGKIDTATGNYELLDAATGNSDELIGLMASETIGHGGQVLVFAQEKMPEAAPVAALLRY